MKIFKGLIFSLLMMAMVLSYAHEAVARGSAVAPGAEPIIKVFPTAHGTKYSGPLTIYYIFDHIEQKTLINGDVVDIDYYSMHFFMRLRKGVNLYSFSGVAEETYEYTDTLGQMTATEDFIQDTVIPSIYCNPLNPPCTDPIALLKSIDMLVENNEGEYPGCCRDYTGIPMKFLITDVVIAVQD
ncbi:MAG: hypothetical protein DRH26_13960 [Deltaproteobacteria bacterium]|nr:MAG: hypothetical protein DRH26_13960 [Deltaproteobacteria bacterium]